MDAPTPTHTDLIEAALNALDQLGTLGAEEYDSLIRALEQAVTDGEYRVTVERVDLEPYSWGASRGSEIEASATLTRWECCGKTGDRDDAIRLLGKRFVEGAESDRADYAADEARSFRDDAA